MDAKRFATRRSEATAVDLIRASLTALRYIVVTAMTSLLRTLAGAFRDSPDAGVAAFAYHAALRLRPSDRVAADSLSRVLVDRAEYASVVAVLERWLAVHPDDLDLHIRLAGAYSELGEEEKAARRLEDASRLGPDASRVIVARGELARRFNRVEQSVEVLNLLNKRSVDGHTYDAYVLMAKNLSDLGRRDAAVELLERAVELAPENPQAHMALAGLNQYRDPSDVRIARMKEWADDDRLSIWDRVSFHFTLGRILDHLGSWDEAFAHYRAGNELRGVRFNDRGLKAMVDGRIKTFDRGFLGASRLVTERPVGPLVFVLGMPRSGTTLVEQILGCHPGVHAGGERRDLTRIIERLHADAGGRMDYPRCVRDLDRGVVERVVGEHLAKVARLAGPARRFVDKAPGNFFEIGLIAMLFPGAKVVHCRRDPLDTCLSCYFQNFDELKFTNDLRALGRYYLQYERLMAHWRSVLPGVVLDLRYEDLVSDPEARIRDVLDYCELPWSPACLEFHRAKRAVHTSSSYQVKSPIYVSSIGKWKHYRRHLQPLMDALGMDEEADAADSARPPAAETVPRAR